MKRKQQATSSQDDSSKGSKNSSNRQNDDDAPQEKEPKRKNLFNKNFLRETYPVACFDSRVEFYDKFYQLDQATSETVELEHKYVIRHRENDNNKDDDDGFHIASISSTAFVHQFFPHFNAEKVIMKMMKGTRWRDSPYYGLSINEIKEQWEQNGKNSSAAGTYMHDRIECFYNIERLHRYRQSEPNQIASRSSKEDKVFQKKIKDDYGYVLYERKASKEMQQFYEFHKKVYFELGWRPFRTELRIYDQDLDLAGSIDMLYLHPEFDDKIPGKKKLIMADWKRCKEIKRSNNFESGFVPLEHLDNCNYNHYSLQLNVYKAILEKYTDYVVAELYLAVFHPDQSTYQMLPIENMQDETNNMFAHHLWHNRNPWQSSDDKMLKLETQDLKGYWHIFC